MVLRPEVLVVPAGEVHGGEIDHGTLNAEDGDGVGLVEGDGEDEVLVVDAIERVDLDGNGLLNGLIVDLGAFEGP